MLPKRQRFSNFDFKKFSYSHHRRGRICTVKFLPNQLEYSRFAIIIDKQLSLSAVKRNLIRRRLYEFIRLNIGRFAKGDYLIIVHQDVSLLSPAELTDNLTNDLL